jgi:hypothetical protein
VKFILLLLALLASFSAFGQEWEQTYGGTEFDGGSSVQQTTDGGYIIAGGTESFGNGGSDVYLIKTDGFGLEQWSQTYGGKESNGGSSVQQTTDGGYIIAGHVCDGECLDETYYNVYLIKTDGFGVEQWSQTYGGTEPNRGYSVEQTTDGGYIIAGWTLSFGDDFNVYLIKTDGFGVEQWSQTYGGTEFDFGYSVQQTTDGGYIIGGYTLSFGNGGADVYLIKTDGFGVEQWSQTYGGTETDGGYLVQQTNDGGYIIGGYTLSFGEDYDVYLIKTDGNGVEQWSQTYGEAEHDFGFSVHQTTDGGFIIAGSTWSSVTVDNDVYLIKTNGNGVEQWSQTYGGTESESGSSVKQTTDGGFIIAGSTLSFGEDYDVYLIKTDSEGTQSSLFTIPTPSNRKLEKVIDILGREVNHTTNQILFHIYEDGTVEKKFVVE